MGLSPMRSLNDLNSILPVCRAVNGFQTSKEKTCEPRTNDIGSNINVSQPINTLRINEFHRDLLAEDGGKFGSKAPFAFTSCSLNGAAQQIRSLHNSTVSVTRDFRENAHF